MNFDESDLAWRIMQMVFNALPDATKKLQVSVYKTLKLHDEISESISTEHHRVRSQLSEARTELADANKRIEQLERKCDV